VADTRDAAVAPLNRWSDYARIDNPFDNRRHLWGLILPNRQLAKVCSLEQTAVNDPVKNVMNVGFASQKCMMLKG